MKRTINEIYELLKQKKENALNDLTRERMRQYSSAKKILKLEGEIEAYQDVIVLIETSEVLWTLYQLVIEGKIVKEAEKIIYLKNEFYLALSEGKNVWIEKEGKKVWFNGKEKKTWNH